MRPPAVSCPNLMSFSIFLRFSPRSFIRIFFASFFREILQDVDRVVFIVEVQKSRDDVFREAGEDRILARIRQCDRNFGLQFGRKKGECFALAAMERIDHLTDDVEAVFREC
jgi:hypothetical protein